MSVVRKYQSGASIPSKNEYSDFIENFLLEEINKEASNGAFTAKGEKALREQASIWAKAAKKGLFDKDEQGNLKYYSTDEFKNTYSVDPKDNAELRALNLGGNDERINTNLFGQFNLDNKKANTWIANAFSRYNKSAKNKPVTTNSTNQEVDFGPLENYVKDVLYHKNDNWGNAWQDITKDLSEKEIQKRIGETYKSYLDWHIGKMNSPEKGVHYNNIDNQEELYNYASKIANGEFTPEDYKKFKDLGSRYGTDFSTFYTPKTEQQIAAEAQEKAAIDSQAYLKELTDQGISEEVANWIITNKYKIGQLGADIPEHVRNYITEKEGIVLDLPNGKQIVIDPEGKKLENHDFTDPDNNPNTYFTNDAQGFRYFAPGTKGYSGSRFADPVGRGKDLRPIIGSFPGYEGYKIYGVPKALNNGERDYIKHLHLINPNNNEAFDLFKKGDAEGVYQDRDGKEISGELTGWGEYVKDAEGVQLAFEPHPDTISAYDKIPAIKKDNLDLDIDSTLYIGRGNVEEIRSILSGLKYIIENEEEYPDLETQNKAHRKYFDILNLLESKSEYTSLREILKNNDKTSNGSWISNITSSWFNKKGGVLKYQQGSTTRKLTREEYNAIYNPTATAKTTANDPNKKGIKSSVGTLRDMNALDAISLGGSFLSILPGVGLYGGLTTTVADAINDYNDGDWSSADTRNLLMNLGFTGLSAVGFGTLGAAAKAAKAAKAGLAADELAKIAKISIEGVEDVAKLSHPIQEGLLKIASGEAKTLSAAGITKEGLKEIKAIAPGLLGKTTSTTTVIPKTLVNKIAKTDFEGLVAKRIDELEKIAQASKPLPSMLQEEFSGIIKGAKYITGKNVLPKAGKIAGMTLGGLGAVNSAYSGINVAGNVLSGNGLDTQVEDLKNTFYLTSGLRGFIKTRPMANLAKKINTTEEGTKELLQIGKTTYKVDPGADKDVVKEALKKINDFKKLKEKTGTYGFRTESAENIRKNEESLIEFKDALTKITGKNLDDDVIKSLAGQKSKIITANNTPADLGVSQKEYDAAKNFSEGKINYWTGKGYYSRYKKKGGILKLEEGKPIPMKYDKEISKNYKYDKGYIDYVFGLDQKWFDAHKEEINKVTGGYPVENLQQLQFLGTDGKYGAIHKYLDYNYQNNDAGNYKTVVPTAVPAPTAPTASTVPTITPVTPVNGPYSTTENDSIKDDSSDIKKRKWPKLNIDKNDIYNLTAFLSANAATNRAIALQKKAAYAGIYSLPYMSRQYFRQTAPNQMFFNKQAAGVMGMSGRMANSTSDFDKGANILFTGQARGQEYSEKGQALDLDIKNRTIQQQMDSDQKVDQFNTQVYGKNKAIVADASSKMFTYDAAGIVAKNQNFQNYLAQLNRSDQIKRNEEKYKNYYDLATDPNITGVYDKMNKLNEQYQLDMDNWNKAQENTPLSRKVLWEDTNEAKKYKEDMKILKLKLEGNQRLLYNSSLALQMPGNVANYKSGGSLNEKKELSRYQHELSRSDKELEIFYKVILKNNELMYKSLSRIFK